jgi:hypothetical protein
MPGIHRADGVADRRGSLHAEGGSPPAGSTQMAQIRRTREAAGRSVRRTVRYSAFVREADPSQVERREAGS